jgi:apolipoprotein N-acyltransferase
VNRMLKPVIYVLAAVYFLVDAAFMLVAKPISDWFAKHLELRRLRDWIRSLGPYRSLALFLVPVIILEPVKPLAVYLAATGQFTSSVLVLIAGELLKLVLVERLFSLTRHKLMEIPAIASAYAKYRQAKAWLQATEGWQTIRSVSKTVRNYVAQIRNHVAQRRADKNIRRGAVRPVRKAATRPVPAQARRAGTGAGRAVAARSPSRSSSRHARGRDDGSGD